MTTPQQHVNKAAIGPAGATEARAHLRLSSACNADSRTSTCVLDLNARAAAISKGGEWLVEVHVMPFLQSAATTLASKICESRQTAKYPRLLVRVQTYKPDGQPQTICGQVCCDGSAPYRSANALVQAEGSDTDAMTLLIKHGAS